MFWELENVEVERTKNEEAIFCEDHFLKTHSRDDEGREHPYDFTTDVKMMYRMILIHESQQPLLRILWKESPEDPVKTFEMKTVTYDTIDELPSERAKEWHRFLEDFNSVSSICISRCIVHPQATRLELHGFADASEKCYGAVIYCRSQSPDDATTVKLVTSKSRVAPVKNVTMPRLELCATVLLAKLMKRVETTFQMTPLLPCTCRVTRLLSWCGSRKSL
ncbi:integrase catalytic domain-containing protein [Trichonephila clavipes]|nr:integrase catalytic domain-containing protein [Trichonephila clavipes]